MQTQTELGIPFISLQLGSCFLKGSKSCCWRKKEEGLSSKELMRKHNSRVHLRTAGRKQISTKERKETNIEVKRNDKGTDWSTEGSDG